MDYSVLCAILVETYCTCAYTKNLAGHPSAEINDLLGY